MGSVLPGESTPSLLLISRLGTDKEQVQINLIRRDKVSGKTKDKLLACFEMLTISHNIMSSYETEIDS